MTDASRAARKYFTDMAVLLNSGETTPELSFYSALTNILNEVGKTVSPSFVCIPQPQDIGDGHPDFVLREREQVQGDAPMYGAMEVKSASEDITNPFEDGRRGKQMKKYLKRYGLLTVTNYREFRLFRADDDGMPELLETLTVADSEDTFRDVANQPKKSVNAFGVGMASFLRRVSLEKGTISDPKDVAWLLAKYAESALKQMGRNGSDPLSRLRRVMEQGLGVEFKKDKENLFRSTLVQTLFYGMFSAWVKDGNDGKFNWELAKRNIPIPVIRALFEQLTVDSHMRKFSLYGIMGRTSAALNRIDRNKFLDAFKEGGAIQYFYELFLAELDPKTRRDMGIWYTPKEIVRYMVERVDHVLRTEMKKDDGLADEDVYILDPCCGTGAYIMEVLKKIHDTHTDKNIGEVAVAEEVKKAAMKRVIGFEIMTAPFVISHWQVSDYLESIGAALESKSDEKEGERAAIYLTNALTGWDDSSDEPKEQLFDFPELAEEHDHAEAVKKESKIFVVIGNPPYSGYAKQSKEEKKLVAPYKVGLRGRFNVKKPSNDLYIGFFRIAERRLNELGRGIVCYISNSGWNTERSWPVMREHLMGSFDKIWIDSMNGDMRRNGGLSPDGSPDSSVFVTDYNKTGIPVGTSVSLLLKKPSHGQSCEVLQRDFWGEGNAKRKALYSSASVRSFDDQYKVLHPNEGNRFSMRPVVIRNDYGSWPSIPEISRSTDSKGIKENRGKALIDIDESVVSDRMRNYFSKSFDDLRAMKHPLAKNMARYDAKKTHEKACAVAADKRGKIVRILDYVFDVRYAYYTSIRPIWNDHRPALWRQFKDGNKFLVSRPQRGNDNEGFPVFFTTSLGSNWAIRGDATYFPFKNNIESDLLKESWNLNFSPEAEAWVESVGFSLTRDKEQIAELPWNHALAIGYSPKYINDNLTAIRIDWPRIPMPKDRKILERSAMLGKRISCLLDTEGGG